ncbi:MAG: ATP-binding cassette domain-containing protein [Desulfobulbaceae bacterium]|nr:ATP-binding cassette domain-containing protein [Desulfobulbaceae bacterium]
MSNLPKIFSGSRSRRIATVATLAVCQAAAAGVTAFATRDVFSAFSAAETTIPLVALTLILVMGVIIALLRVAECTISENVGQTYTADLRKALFIHLSRMPAREVTQRRSGALAMRFIGDLTAVRSWVNFGVARLISTAIVIPGALLALILLNPYLAAATSLPLLLSVVLMAFFAPGLHPLHRRLRSKRARLAADMSERVPVAPELRLLGRDAREIKRLNRRTLLLRDAAVTRARASATLRAIPDIGVAFAGIFLLWMAFRTGASSAEAAGALATMAIIAMPLRNLAGIWDRRYAWKVAMDKCQAILNSPVLESAIEQQSASSKKGAICLKLHQICSPAMRNINITASPGQKISIVGPNGSGKSTLLTLSAGLEHSQSGYVTIDGVDIRALSKTEKSSLISYLGPRSPILKGSLRRALTLGIHPRPTDKTIKAVALDFGLGSVLDRLGGIGGKLSEAGKNLSSGEARRVHLVRIWLAQPRLLLLDEPDDALDVAGRKLVAKLIRDTQATTLLVTHDLSLARQMDKLWFVDKGILHESGSPETLLSGSGKAAEFFINNKEPEISRISSKAEDISYSRIVLKSNMTA